jgi:hypothetical protein
MMVSIAKPNRFRGRLAGEENRVIELVLDCFSRDNLPPPAMFRNDVCKLHQDAIAGAIFVRAPVVA